MAKKKAKGPIDFGDERATFAAQLEQAKQELTELEAKLKDHGVQTSQARASLQRLRVVVGGKLPTKTRGRGKARGKIKALEVNSATNRPPRGSRRQQVEDICASLGRGGESFRSVAVLNALRDIEGDVTNGMKSYTYTVLNTLGEEGVLNKVGRGKWTLA